MNLARRLKRARAMRAAELRREWGLTFAEVAAQMQCTKEEARGLVARGERELKIEKEKLKIEAKGKP